MYMVNYITHSDVSQWRTFGILIIS